MVSTIYKFPPENSLRDYLLSHPSTGGDAYKWMLGKKSKIIDQLTSSFALTTKTPKGLQIDLALALSQLNESIKLPNAVIEAIRGVFERALKDCGSGMKLRSRL